MFGERIKEIRTENKLRQIDLAEILLVSRSAISNWENNKSYPDILTIVEISNYFDVSLDYLLKEDKKMVIQLNDEVKKGRFYLKWYIELFMFVISFFVITYLMNKLLDLEFNIVSEIFTGVVFYIAYKWINRNNKGENSSKNRQF